MFSLLTLREAAALVEGPSTEARIRRLRRAIDDGLLPVQDGRDKRGRRVQMVAREDVLAWRASWRTWPLQEDEGDDDGRRTTDDGAAGRTDAGGARDAADVALERFSATLRDVQAGAIGEVSRQLEPLLCRLEALSERCGRLEAEKAQLQQRVWELEQGQAPKRHWWWLWGKHSTSDGHGKESRS